VTVRSSTDSKSIRLSWPDGTSVALGFLARGAKKSTVSVQHEKLPSKEDAARMKVYWGEKLDALGELLG
jgi:hypothetical protein